MLLVAALSGGLLLPSTAIGSKVLHVRGDRVIARDDPTLPPVSVSDPLRIAGIRSAPSRRPHFDVAFSAKKRRGLTIAGAVKRAQRRGTITSEQRNDYLKIYRRARSTYKKLSGNRKQELGDVLATLQSIAKRKALTSGRMPALFLILDRNRQWWNTKVAPSSGARVTFSGSRVIFQYYPGHGLQIQPLANFGKANGLWGEKRTTALRSLIDDLVALKTKRGNFVTWEYYFPFGGGQPPWTSGMSQGTAIQALARTGQILVDPSYFEVARSALGAFEKRTTTGVRVPEPAGAWYALYSFSPQLKVLNGFLQALIGLYDLNNIDPNPTAERLFQEGDAVARADLDRYDTGAWSLYARPGGEADLNYHKLQTEFLKKLCSRTGAAKYCNAADRFKSYLKTPPTISSAHFKPAPVKRFRRTVLRFNLSKVSTVTLKITKQDGTVIFTRSYSLGYGRRSLSWTAPKKSHRYKWSLSAVDLAGNRIEEPARGTIRVRS